MANSDDRDRLLTSGDPMASNARNRRALITGAGNPEGIGFAIARALGRSGYDLVVTSTSQRIAARVTQLRDEGFSARGVAADLMDPEAVRELAVWAGPVDMLVNNAGMASLGILDNTGALETLTDETWRKTIDRNLTTAFYMIRACLPGMKSRRWGRIVNIASTTGTVSGIANDSVYAAAKAGMVGLTRSLCLEVAAYQITVNAIAPGWIATSSQTASEARAGNATPMKRSGTPDEIAGGVAFLCSDSAAYLTGQVIIIDGGNCLVEDKGC